jgi:hypothetical protein
MFWVELMPESHPGELLAPGLPQVEAVQCQLPGMGAGQ